jgi:aminoglycoside 2''-phosphotransferase
MLQDPWKSDAPLDTDIVRAMIDQAYPEMADFNVSYLGEGWDFRAFLVGDIVFRFPKREEYVRYFEVERALLSSIPDDLPIAVPRYDYVIHPNSGYPFEGGGYRCISGSTGHSTPMTLSPQSAKSLGVFLSAIHAIPREDLERLGFTGFDESSNDEIRRYIDEDIECLKRIAPRELYRIAIQAIDKTIAPSSFDRLGLCFIHGDLLPEHVIVDDSSKSIRGVIDWTDANWGDRAGDFVGLWLWQGEDYVNELLKNYRWPVGDDIWTRIRYYGLRAALSHTAYGYKSGKEDYRLEGEGWLRNRYSSE